jgi:peptidase, S49 family
MFKKKEEVQLMWKEILLNYGIFLLELLTVFGVIALVVLIIIQSKKRHENGTVVLTDLSENYQKQQQSFETFFLNEEEAKHWEKEEKKKEKEKVKAQKKCLKEGVEKSAETQKPRLFVLDFDGDLYARAVGALRNEVTAVLSIARSEDEVLLRLESPGGVVHGYGLAASQLRRLRERNIPLTVAVDKVAASGGYMMACVADKIVSAPFAIIGSVGVVAEVPNIHRLLKKYDIDVDVMTAGGLSVRLPLWVKIRRRGSRNSSRNWRKRISCLSSLSARTALNWILRKWQRVSIGSVGRRWS